MENEAIRAHMEVVGSDGAHVGLVDALEGDMIKLTKNDAQSNDEHHWVPLAWVAGVDQLIRLNRPAEAAFAEWLVVDPEKAAELRAIAADATDSTGTAYEENRARANDSETF
jgi:hypothetical protein